ncbi:hypothetical protein [Hyphobacterium sp.]|uniref:hypothetical protein n=1 Tax=Hyphobacterium sp. TaxID=2004662 RepID=UPI003748AFD3
MTDTSHTSRINSHSPVQHIQIKPRISHALDQLAGPWADHLAELFPFPHSDFVDRSSMWMHVAGLVLANPISSNNNVRVVFNHHRDWRDAAFVGSPRFTADNVYVLKKLTLPLWTREEYRLFTPLLDCDRALKLMAHADQVTPALVRKIAHLPAEFRDQKIVQFLLTEGEATLLHRLFNHRGDHEKKRIVSSLKSQKDRPSFWRKASQYFFEGFREFSGVLDIADDRFQTIRHVHELIQTSRKYKVCVNNYVFECLSGMCGFLIFHGKETAIICYEPRIGNRYIIDEINLPQNKAPSDETITEITSVLKDYGFDFGDIDPVEVFRSIDNRMHRLAIAGHELDSNKATEKLHDRLDQIDQIRSVG